MKVRDAMKPTQIGVVPAAFLGNNARDREMAAATVSDAGPQGFSTLTPQQQELMTDDAMYADPEEDVMAAQDRMVAHGFSSLPVIENGRLIGTVRLMQ